MSITITVGVCLLLFGSLRRALFTSTVSREAVTHAVECGSSISRQALNGGYYTYV